jgi:hypothetical protein
MEPTNVRQEKESLLEYVSALNSLELAALIHVRQTPVALRTVASRILQRLKYTDNYKAIYDISQDKNPLARMEYYWDPIKRNGSINEVLGYEAEFKLEHK